MHLDTSAVSSDRGPYDALYESRDGPLWGTPGRLVRRVQEWLSVGATVFDAGCGDGKNAQFLEEGGYSVRGCDVSGAAIQRLRRRFNDADRPSSRYVISDVSNIVLRPKSLDCLLSYGLFHCLDQAHRINTHRKLLDSVRLGGVALFSTLIDTRDIATDHLTPRVTLASPAEIERLFFDQQVLFSEVGTITEDHKPLVPVHSHDVLWIVSRRVQ